MNDWLLSSMVAFASMALVFALLWWHERGSSQVTYDVEHKALEVYQAQETIRADGLQRENERLIAERDEACAQRDRIQQELHVADQTIERFIDENTALKAQVEVLIQERGDASEDILAPLATQTSTEAQVIRNTRQRKGAARKEP